MSYKPHRDENSSKEERIQRRRIRAGNLIYSVFIVALVCVTLFCGFFYVDKHFNDYITQKRYEDLAGTEPPVSSARPSGGFVTGLPDITFDPNGTVEPHRPTTSYEPTDIEKEDGYVNRQNKVWDLKEQTNPDVVGWLYIPEVTNYPVLMDDNDYYLKHDMYGNETAAGALFMTSFNELNPFGYNTIIHGHNMTNGSMFGKLKNYTTLGSQAFFDTHRRVYFDTLYGTYRFEVFSVYITNKEDPDYRRHGNFGPGEYVEYLNRLRDRGMFKDESAVFTENDRILTLSTCNSDEGSSKRTIVHARLVWPKPGSDQTVTPKPEVTVTDTPDTAVRRVVKLNDPSVPLKLRSKPSTSSEIKGTLPHGTVLEVTEDLGDWIGVRTQEGAEGYVYKLYTVPYDEFDFDTQPTGTAGSTKKPDSTKKPEPTKRPGGTVKPENTPEPEVSGTQEPENTPDIPAPEVSGEETEAPVGPETSGEE